MVLEDGMNESRNGVRMRLTSAEQHMSQSAKTNPNTSSSLANASRISTMLMGRNL